MESASAFIDKKIKELGDWRGKTLAKVRGITISLCTKPPEKSPKKPPPKRKILKGTGFSPYINASIQIRL
jgi:hypothetical protein